MMKEKLSLIRTTCYSLKRVRKQTIILMKYLNGLFEAFTSSASEIASKIKLNYYDLSNEVV